MNIPFSPPDIGEREIELITDALKSGWITTGPKTKDFENQLAKYMGTNKCVCLNSSTAAMELTLRVLGVGPGDEVILPAYTYTATCSVVCHVGAKPVMVDIQKDNPEMDYEKMAGAITPRTKVIMPVDLGGVLCDYETMYKVIEEKAHLFEAENEIQKAFGRIVVLSDCSHGFGAQQKGLKAGKIADFTCFSFHAVKNLTTAEGGAVTWQSREGIDDEELYKQYMNLSLHGQTKDALNKNKLGAWEYDILSPAYKCNMTDLQGALGLVQLERYQAMLDRRHQIIDRYDEVLKNYKVTVHNHHKDNSVSSGHLYLMRVDGIGEEERNKIIESFAQCGVATNVHYKPLPMLTAYKNMGFKVEDYPNAYDYYKNEITLPLYSKMSDKELNYIVEVIEKVLKEYRR